MRFFKKINCLDFAALTFTILFIIAGILVSLNRFWQSETFFYDFGIFDQAIWKVAHFSPPIIEHLVVGNKWIFADHFSPSIFLLSPLFWITSRSEILLIAQASIVGLSGAILYLIGIEITKNRFASLAVLTCYFLFLGLQNAIITDFHEATVATLPLVLAYYAIIKKKLKLYFFLLILVLGFKELNFVLGFGVGVSIFLINKKLFKVALITCALSLVWGFLAIKTVIPYFSGGIYQYTEPFNPINVFSYLFNNPLKRETMFNSFLSFGFLPLFSPPFWFLIFQDFLTRFYSSLGTTRATLGFHYSALLSVIMGISSIFSLRLIQKKLPKKTFNILLIALILNGLFLYRFKLHGPLAMAYNPDFYKHTSDFRFLEDLVKKIPESSSVVTQNNLAVRFTHQPVWLLRKNYAEYRPDYILIDARPGQNPNNFFGGENPDKLLWFIKRDVCYKIEYQTKYQYLFKREAKGKTCPEIADLEKSSL